MMNHLVQFLNLKEFCIDHQIDVKGIVQVGAHRGQETEEFLTLEPNRILMIEALPYLADSLANKYKSIPQIRVVGCAISNYDGVTDFNICSNESSSSMLPLERCSEIYPLLVIKREIRLECRRLDSLMGELNENLSDYNFLMVDVQGAEMLVFEGSLELLKNIKVIHVEINHIELYKGGVLEVDLTKFLETNGFEKKEEISNESWGDALYVKMRKSA